MAKIKYIPAEIDDVNVFGRNERKLVAADVARGEYDEEISVTVEETLVDHGSRISALEQGGTGPGGDFDSILVSTITWLVLVDFNGNVLSTGV